MPLKSTDIPDSQITFNRPISTGFRCKDFTAINHGGKIFYVQEPCAAKILVTCGVLSADTRSININIKG